MSDGFAVDDGSMIDWATFGATLIAAGGGSALIVLGIMKAFGAQWLRNHFATQLEKSRQDHATATEHLKFRIAGLLDRATKLNQREFETLPDIWQKANAAYGTTAYLVNPFRSEPDFSRMGEQQFDEFLDDLEAPSFRKAELKAETPQNRNRYYREIMRWEELNAARKGAREFSEALAGGSIYLHPETHAKLKNFEKRLVDAIHDRQFEMQHPRQPGDGPRETDDAKAFRKNGNEWFDELGDFLRDRYWGKGAAAVDESR